MTRRGFCPGLYTPMASGDGLLVRVKPFTPLLAAATLRALGRAAAEHGNGRIELTSRGHLQVRGLRADSVEPFARDMLALGLAGADRAAERRRSLTVSPLAGRDETCAADTLMMSQALTDAVAQAAELEALPAKFHFAVDGGGALPLGDPGCDVLLRAGRGAWHVGWEGGGSIRCDRNAAAQVARRLARIAAMRGQRLREAVAAYGPCGVFAMAGLSGAVPMPAAVPVPAVGQVAGVFGLGLPFGRLDAAQLADFADDYGCGAVRLTPWRSVLLPGVRQPPALIRAARGLITSPLDPSVRLIACPGQPGCASAKADIRADAARLQALVPAEGVLHLSGCAKGCAHPGPAAVTLVATTGGYDLVRDGRASDAPVRRGLDVATLIAGVA